MKLFKFLFGLLIIPYFLIAVFVTACLVRYNDFGITTFGKYSVIVVEDNELNPYFDSGDLVFVKKNDNSEVNADDYIFFYNTYEKQVSVNFGKIIGKEEIKGTNETTYMLESNKPLSSEYFIGKGDTAIRYKNMGKVLNFLESRYGYLFVFILPILVMFIYEIYAIVMEVKNATED